MIIRSVRHRGLKRLIEDNQIKGLRSDLVNRIRNIITALILADDMTAFRSSSPPGWRVHQLSGDRKDTWSVSTSGNWRITFIEEGGFIDVLDLEDYH
ncbi:MAG: type II toxin-antitoxin system RelE/ParE family toxin [Nitrospirales bacterium]